MKVGDKFFWKGDDARVMAIAEGYIMARKKGCYPFLASVKEIEAAQMEPTFTYKWHCTECGKWHSDKEFYCPRIKLHDED